MNPKEFFTRHIRGWFPEDHKMPENTIYALMGRYYMPTRLSDFVKFLSNISIGIGLAYASMLVVMALSLVFQVTNYTGTIALLASIIAIGSAYLYVYRKSFNVDSSLILKFCLAAFFIGPVSFQLIPLFQFKDFLLPVTLIASAFLAIGLVGIHKNKAFLKICSGIFFIGLFTCIVFFRTVSIPVSLFPPFLAIPGFLAVGLVGIYGYEKYRKLGFCCMALSLMFLVCVPIVNVWQIQSSYSNELSSAIYNVYTIPLILASSAFFVLGITLIRYKKFQTINVQELSDTAVVKHDSTGNPQKELTVEKNNIDFKNLGFSLILFSQLSIIWAAIVYVRPGIWDGFSPDPLSVLPFIAIGVALFALGVASKMYKKPKKLGFLGVVSGSVTLIIATFAYIHDATSRYSFKGSILVSYDLTTPYKDFALTLLLASIVLFAVGYILMLKKSRKTAPTELYVATRISQT